MKFTKMHGLGNDYIYVNCFKENVENPSALSIEISDRHFGIGSDGLVLIMPSETEDFRMRMFNNDGSEGEMCGNAIRCIGKYVYDNGLTKKEIVSVETLGGTKVIALNIKNGIVESARVDMGGPILEPEKIPVNFKSNPVVNEPIIVDGKTYEVTCVSMGNPHAITYMEQINHLELDKIGPSFEFNEKFPNRINTEFVEVISRKKLKMRVWERGSGETLACGTGACAVLVASVLNGLSERVATVELKGGSLKIEWNQEDNHVYMTGPATKVFDGEIEI
ncbi:diaminopimelate epimerase [endosymbiont 'TC1' of Trimyema compressum]|uniref:diaminopimelate epimerase n=1 Tax=endosymbiont 'TC1' of Trimyema compressum TaxID=243899 RepID=UPI0007F074E9|nr:diaminopimelate epimerase [endosymbiont 'TC1' of Trimyema compressum]AMP19980.1 diaminopimelate epimerase [endosymbiont 'TC1' of Trimyema compressum]